MFNYLLESPNSRSHRPLSTKNSAKNQVGGEKAMQSNSTQYSAYLRHSTLKSAQCRYRLHFPALRRN